MDFPSLSMEDCLRQAHPFPLFERVALDDIHVGDKCVLKAGTHAFMFPAGWKEHHSWPVFGAGKRACAGAYLARPWLKALKEALIDCGTRSQPKLGHRYSGRNNDTNASFSEVLYFLKTFLLAIVRPYDVCPGMDT